MSHYSEKPTSCRVDFFRERGKWVTTEAFELDYDHVDGPEGALRYAISVTGTAQARLRGLWAVCLDPYHKNSYPVMLRVE